MTDFESEQLGYMTETGIELDLLYAIASPVLSKI